MSTKNKPKFNDEQAHEMRKKYEQGATVEGLGKEYGTSATTVCRTIRRIGGVVRTQNYKTTKFDDEVACVMRKKYEDGYNLYQLVEEYGTHPSTISNTIKRVGGTIRPTGFPKGTKIKKNKNNSTRGLLGWINESEVQ